MTLRSPSSPSLAQWRTFCELLSGDASDMAHLLTQALQALLDFWPARAIALSCVRVGTHPLGVRVGSLPIEAQRIIAQQADGNTPPGVQIYALPSETLAATPIDLHGTTVGGLFVLFEITDVPVAELEFASTLISHALLRLSTAGQLRRDLRELGLITNITRSLNTTLNLRMLLQNLIAATQALLDVEAASVLLVDEQRHELVFEVTAGTGNQPTYLRMPIDQGIAGAVVKTGEPEIVNDVANDPRFFRAIDDETGLQTQALLAVPLLGRSGVIGVLEAINRRDGQPFEAHDLDLATILSSQAAVSVENARLYEELQAERDRLIRREAEVRAQIGRDLHDGPVQQVAAAGMYVNLLRTIRERAPEQLSTALDDLDQQLKQATSDLRTVLYELRPLGIEQEGLYVVLSRYVEKFRNPQGMRLILDLPTNLRRLPLQREAPTLIIIQEAVNNVRKHAQASEVRIALRDIGDELVVTVRDNGKGFDVAALERGYVRQGSFGLLNMRERAELIGGTWSIQSQQGTGTLVTIKIPFEAAAQAA